MNNRNRHMQYRKSIYRKRRIRTILILSCSAAVIAFVLFIIIGTALHNKTQSKNTDIFEDQTYQKETSGLKNAQPIGAYALPLLQDGSNFSDRLRAIPETAGAVCINLNREDGTLLYSSELTQNISGISVAPDASGIASAVSSIDSNDLYISSVLYVPSFENENDLIEDIELSIWGAVACEALREGVGDVLIIAPSLEVEDMQKLYLLADRIHAAVPDSVIGFLLSDTILTDTQKTSLVDELNKHFNYLALDTSSFSAEDDPVEYIENRTSKMQLDLMYYKMRVLLPYSSDTVTQQKYIETVEKYNISSWQILP